MERTKSSTTGGVTGRLKIGVITAMALALTPAVVHAENPAVPSSSTLYGGQFGDYLMLSTDREAGVLEGFYDDGKCRFAFRAPLEPALLYQRSDFGEAYIADSWEPAHPEERFTTEIFSRARGGFQEQLTLAPTDLRLAPDGCRRFITLDRDDWFEGIGVRVIKARNAPVFEIGQVGHKPEKVRHPKPEKRVPAAGQGVWVMKTYSPDYSPDGYVYANWPVTDGRYSGMGGGYIREQDLFPLPEPPADPWSEPDPEEP